MSASAAAIFSVHCMPDIVSNMADAGDTTAVAAAAIVAFLIKTLLSIETLCWVKSYA